MEPLCALRSVLVHAQQAICAMGGHDYLLRWTSGRIFLQCADCGYETPGWRIDAKIGARDCASSVLKGSPVGLGAAAPEPR